jgi:hypothetical protein
MTGSELKSLRQLLFFTVPEAALLVASSAAHPIGVEQATWKKWEDGAFPVPDFIAEQILHLCRWRSKTIKAFQAAITDARQRAYAESPDMELDISVVWYATLDDWLTLDERDPVMWRPQCSVAIEAVFFGAHLVKFDSLHYARWLGRRTDSETLRGEWAASKLG